MIKVDVKESVGQTGNRLFIVHPHSGFYTSDDVYMFRLNLGLVFESDFQKDVDVVFDFSDVDVIPGSIVESLRTFVDEGKPLRIRSKICGLAGAGRPSAKERFLLSGIFGRSYRDRAMAIESLLAA